MRGVGGVRKKQEKVGVIGGDEIWGSEYHLEKFLGWTGNFFLFSFTWLERLSLIYWDLF